METLTGIELIVAERARQLQIEGWTPEHDDSHDRGELAFAAATYLQANVMLRDVRPGYGIQEIERYLLNMYWPASWGENWLKVSPDPVVNATKAGALMAAEIDRLQRLEMRRNGVTP